MLDSIVILFLAWTFSDLLIQELHSGSYLAHLVVNLIPAALLPAIFFILTAICSIAIGSSWGTIAVMLPLAIPMVVEMSGLIPPTTMHMLPLLFPVVGAIFAGAIGGDHVSPLSSTTVMSSTSSGAYHHDHVLSQLEYAAPVFITCIISYIITGYTIHLGFYKTLALSYGISIPLCLGLLLYLNYRNKSTPH